MENTDKEIRFDLQEDADFISAHELAYLAPEVRRVHDMIHAGEGPGNEYAGWLEWPGGGGSGLSGGGYAASEEFARIKDAAGRIKEMADVLIVIGIGGSYLGAKAALQMLQHTFYNQLPAKKRGGPEIYFAGFNVSPVYLQHLLELVEGKDLVVNVISKSGTTLEPALSFRVFRRLLESRYGREGASKRIFATTDQQKGALKKLADEEGYETFVVPENIGGRYSVLTAVGLLPMAVGGIDIDEVMKGAEAGYRLCSRQDLASNPAYQYAAARSILYRKGKTLELLATYEPALSYFSEWWKQLFGESEGKDQKGIFPASVSFTRDLHSLGQYIQDGRRNLFATTLWVETPPLDLKILSLEEDIDGLNYLAGKSFHFVNDKACRGTMAAHSAGGVPNLKITVPELNPYYFGELAYFFEKACGISAYMLGVNPFDQPGVEAYKSKMFSLLQG